MERVRGLGELRSIRPGVLAFLAVVLGFVAQGRFAADQVRDAVLLYAVAAALFAFALRDARLPVPGRARGGAYPSRRIMAAGLFLLLSVLLAVLALRRFGQEGTDLAGAWHLHLASLGAVLAGLVALGRRQEGAEEEASEGFSFSLSLDGLRDRALTAVGRCWAGLAATPPWEAALLVVILALALFMRLYQFDSWPFGTWYDEAVAGIEARQILQYPGYRPLFWESMNHPAHLLYLFATSFRIFGESTQSMRLVMVAFGTGAVFMAYLFGRELGGRRLGLVAAFLMAVGRWPVNASRIAMTGIETPFFELLTLWLLLRGLRTREVRDFALAGLSLGLGLCFYSAFRLFPAVLVLFFLHLLLTDRTFWKAQRLNLAAFGLAALLAVAPVAQFALEHPDRFLNRTKQTSVFAGKSREQGWRDLKANARKHVLMFNYKGDPNGRHNLPGEPMLDYATSAFAVLGMGYALSRWRRPRQFLLTYWVLIMLAGGVFSLSFEAPQAHRSVGSLPAAFLLAALALERFGREIEWAWRRRGTLAYGVVLAGLLAYVGYTNYDIYFHRQVRDFASWNAFSAPETLAARTLARLGNTVNYQVISLYHQHPVLRFLAPGVTQYDRLETTDSMPIRRALGKDLVMIMDAERESLYLQVRQYYPQADCREHRPPFGGPVVLYTCRLTPADVASLQGLPGAYYAGTDWEGTPQTTRKDAQLRFQWPADAPLSLPFAAEWRGVLSISTYGEYTLSLVAPDAAQVYLDETMLLETLAGGGEDQASVPLAKGNHAIRVRAVGAEGAFELRWQPPGQPPQTLPTTALYGPPVTNNGLLGKYYPNGEWREPPAFAQIDPRIALYFHIIPLPRPYTVEWVGKVMAPVEGEYRFGLESIDESEVFIDGQRVAASPMPNQYQEGAIYLSAGLHDVRIRFADRTDHTHVNFWWTPPGGGHSIVPSDVLFPPQGSYELIQVPKPVAPQVPPAAPTEALGAATVQFDAGWGGQEGDEPGAFRQPRDVAVDPAGYIYVADTGNQRVQKLDSAGEAVYILTGDGDESFVQPVSLDVDAEGNVWVLDAEEGWIYQFDSDGNPLRRIGGPPVAFFHPRGLTLSPRGTLLVADTGGCRVVELDVGGKVLQQYARKGSGPGELDQPTEVLADKTGYLYVVDTNNNRIQVLDPSGGYAGEWSIPKSNTVDHSDLAWGPRGEIYLTEPEPATVAVVDREGQVLGRWGGRGTAAGQFEKPLGVAVDGQGRVYVADPYNHRIQRFVVQWPEQ